MLHHHSLAPVRDAYNKVASTYADYFQAHEAESPLDVATIAHFASLLPGSQRVLDAGCGPGRLFPVLADHGCEVEGIDLSEAMIERARLDYPGYQTAVGSLTDLPYPDSCFDGWLSWYSTIHGDDAHLAAALAEAQRVLVPGGVALLAFQVGEGLRDVGEVYREFGHDVSLVRLRRTPEQVAKALARAGFREVARVVQVDAADERDPHAVLIGVAGQAPSKVP